MELQEMIEVLQNAQDAKDLLERVYYQIDAYSGEFRYGAKLDNITLDELKKFFGFDDSE